MQFIAWVVMIGGNLVHCEENLCFEPDPRVFLSQRVYCELWSRNHFFLFKKKSLYKVALLGHLEETANLILILRRHCMALVGGGCLHWHWQTMHNCYNCQRQSLEHDLSQQINATAGPSTVRRVGPFCRKFYGALKIGAEWPTHHARTPQRYLTASL